MEVGSTQLFVVVVVVVDMKVFVKGFNSTQNVQ
jgi:hypothetical protein